MAGRGGLSCCFLLLAVCVAQLRCALRAADGVVAAGAGVEDLGEGLFYFRVGNLAAQIGDVRAALAKHAALVVDLRGVEAGMADARALRAALTAADGGGRVARFVLINGATAAAIPFSFDAGLPEGGVPGVVIFAPGAANVPADVKAPGSVEDDRAACEAIARGAAVTSLINHQPEKMRYDEAVLVREHEGVPEADAVAQSGSGAGEGAGADGKSGSDAQGGVVTDSVLQVAVQTHRALVALGKIQGVR